MHEILNYFGVGGFALIFLSVFIEITPIKINPLKWLGKHLFSSFDDRLSNIENKLDGHIVQSYRNNILDFQNECIDGKKHSREQFRVVLKAIDDYERYITENNLTNGEIAEASLYIKRVYQKALTKADFIDVSNKD